MIRTALVSVLAALVTSCGPNPTTGEDAGAADSAGAADAAPAPVEDAGTPPDATMPPDASGPPRVLQGTRLLGEGGFFGISGIQVGAANGKDPMFAIGAHYAELPAAAGTEKQGGRVYLFQQAGVPSSVADAVSVLEPPDLAVFGGFGWALAPSCDLDQDGYPDLPVGSHLYSDGGPKTNAGRVVVFWGDASGTFAPDRATSHALEESLRARSDSFGQTVLCADFDGDGVDDLFASGQNGGAADTGIGAFFHGKKGARLGATHDQAVYPALPVSKQYFGAASLFEDLDGDGVRDLAVGAWGLIRGDVASGPHTGGLAVFKGGADWSKPAFQLTPATKAETHLGSALLAFTTHGGSFLAATASEWAADGAVVIYQTGGASLAQGTPLQVLKPTAELAQAGFGSAVAYVPDYFGQGRGALLVGVKYADVGAVTGAGAVAVFPVSADGRYLEEPPTLLAAPEPAGGDTFGAMIAPLGDLNGDGLSDFMVGIPQHLEGDSTTGQQTGGVVVYQ